MRKLISSGSPFDPHLRQRLERFPAALLEEIYNCNKRWVVRAMHPNEHLDEVDAALKR